MGITTVFLSDSDWITFQQPLYSPDLAIPITTSFGSKCGWGLKLLCDVDLQTLLNARFKNLDKSYARGIEFLV